MREKTKKLLSASNIQQKAVALYLEEQIHKGNEVLEENIINSSHSIKDCFDYITDQAREHAVKGSFCDPTGVQVFAWAEEYYSGAYKKVDEKAAKKAKAAATAKTAPVKHDTISALHAVKPAPKNKEAEQLSLF